MSADAAYDELTEGPFAKLERAQKHINDLNGQVTDYLQNSPLELRVRQSIDPPRRLVYVQAKHAIPAYFALIIGDAVHNLRTALDHVCFAMVGDKTAVPDRVGFPFAKGPGDSLSGAITTRQMHLAGEKVGGEIHLLKPYPGGNKYLNAVKVLDERDKHHFILTVGVGVQFSVAQMGSLVGHDMVSHIPPQFAISSVGDFVVNLPEDTEIEVFDKKADFQPVLTIGFGAGEELANLPVIASLTKMVAKTHDAIFRLASAFAEL